jgi:hypothetical protein
MDKKIVNIAASIVKVCPFLGTMYTTHGLTGTPCIKSSCNFFQDDKCLILESLIAKKVEKNLIDDKK